MKILAVIPSRFASTRLPGKPLALIGEKPMIQWVYENVSKAKLIAGVVVATDDQRIFESISGIGGECIMTDAAHPSGTDRVVEVMKHFPGMDAFINVQGDEPFIHPREIDLVAAMLEANGNETPVIVTLVRKLDNPESLTNPSVVKVVCDKENRAMYFSRSPIPFLRDIPNIQEWPKQQLFWQHIGIYGYNQKALSLISHLKPSVLEKAESLEQLRWLENGIPIFTGETQSDSISVDTAEDLEQARILYKKIYKREG